MKNKNILIATIFNDLGAALLFLFGIVYLLKGEFMPYHAEAISLSWEEVDSSTQVLLLALMRCVGGGFLSVSFSVFILQYYYQRSLLNWIPWVIFFSGLIVGGASFYATLFVRMNTLGHPPIILAFVGVFLFFIGFIFNKRSVKK